MSVLIGVCLAVTGGVGGIVTCLYLVLAAAPAAWWLGAVLTLLDRIARNGERRESERQEIHKTPAASRATAKPLMRAEDEATPYKL